MYYLNYCRVNAKTKAKRPVASLLYLIPPHSSSHSVTLDYLGTSAIDTDCLAHDVAHAEAHPCVYSHLRNTAVAVLSVILCYDLVGDLELRLHLRASFEAFSEENGVILSRRSRLKHCLLRQIVCLTLTVSPLHPLRAAPTLDIFAYLDNELNLLRVL